MERFPRINKDQVALMYVEYNTGHVLDNELKLAVNDKQKVYNVFESKETAIISSKEFVKKKNLNFEDKKFGKN